LEVRELDDRHWRVRAAACGIVIDADVLYGLGRLSDEPTHVGVLAQAV
jgi:hypothetical protein